MFSFVVLFAYALIFLSLGAHALPFDSVCPKEFRSIFDQQSSRSAEPKTYSIRYHSKALRGWAKVNITVPAGFPQADEAAALVFFLHGRGGDQDENGQFTSMGGVSAMKAVMVNRQCSKRFLLVAPFDQRSSYWRQGPRAGRIGTETMLTKELISMLRLCGQRTIDQTSAPAIGGISAGGNAAFYYGAKYPNLFGQVYALSPVFRPDKDEALKPEDRKAFGKDRDFDLQDARYWYQKGRPGADGCRYPVSRFRVETAVDDVFINNPDPSDQEMSEVVKSTKDFLGRLEKDCPGRSLHPSLTGGHSEKFWRGGVSRMIRFFCEGFENRNSIMGSPANGAAIAR